MKQRVTHSTRQLGHSSDLLASEVPLDEDEQEKIVQDLEKEQLRQTRMWRACFGAIALLMSAFFAWASWSQWAQPWSLQLTGELQVATNENTVTSVLATQSASLAIISLAMLRQLPKKGELERACMPYPATQKLMLLSGLAGSTVCAVYWLLAHARMVRQFGLELGARWELLWVPLAPVAFSAACLWAASSLATSSTAVAELRSYKYMHKKV